MKKYLFILIVVLLFFLVGFIFFKYGYSEVSKHHAKVIIENNVLIIKLNNDMEYKENLFYPQDIDQITLNSYNIMKLNDDTVIIVLANCKEVEERGSFNTLLVYLYEDSDYIKLLNGLDDNVFKQENYLLTYLGDRNINISFPEADLNLTLKNILKFEDKNQNEAYEKDLISRMEHKSNLGYLTLSRECQNIVIFDSDNEIKIQFSKLVYGFFHGDLIGKVHYEYVYREGMNNLLQTLRFEPDEHYEIVTHFE